MAVYDMFGGLILLLGFEMSLANKHQRVRAFVLSMCTKEAAQKQELRWGVLPHAGARDGLGCRLRVSASRPGRVEGVSGHVPLSEVAFPGFHCLTTLK